MKKLIAVFSLFIFWRYSYSQTNTFPATGNVGIGTVNPQYPLDVAGQARLGIIGGYGSIAYSFGFTRTYGAMLYDESGVALTLGGNGTGVDVYILANGNVGIGTPTTGNYKLAVEGQIGARSIKVTQSSWADLVFDSSYTLTPLKDVENYIASHKHLPDIPSAIEMARNGNDLAKTDTKLLRKIEELTLYLINQSKQIDSLKEEIEELKKLNR